jgi:adenine-specific DNA-methyltransferase
MLCYLDPPYNTGNDGFGYNDRFNQSSWLTFMKNRLEAARDLLRDDGTIAISIAQNEVAYLLVLLDEIFGSECRKNIITVRRASATGAKVINPGVINISEYIVIYCKDPSAWNPGRVFREKERDARYNKVIVNPADDPKDWQYASVLDAFAASEGVAKAKLKAKLGDGYDVALEAFYYSNADRVVRFGQLDPTQVSKEAVRLKAVSIADPTTTYVLPRGDKSTRYIYRGEVILFFRDRLLDVDGKKVFGEPITDIWDDVLPNDLHNEGGVSFRKGKKPEKLIARLVELTTKPGDIVLDFFLGSGTTAGVCHKLGRTYLGVEQLAYGDNDSVARLKNTIAGEQSGISRYSDWTGGGSFVYCELKQLNDVFAERICLAETAEQLLGIWNEIKHTGFVSYKVRPRDFNARDFGELNLEAQRRLLFATLDKNLLYVNYCDILDADNAVSEQDQSFNNGFYGTAQ